MGEEVGLLTFLLTDIEGSAKAWEADPGMMRRALQHHDQLVGDIIRKAGGTVFKTLGDGVCAVFHEATAAVSAALSIQVALNEGDAGEWEPGDVVAARQPLRTRMGLHSGSAEERSGDYLGPAVNRTARIRDAAHGGQILLSQATAALVQDHLPQGAALKQLGLHRLKDLQRPENLYQLTHPALREDFGPLRTLSVARHNLPVDLTSFIGRDVELAEVRNHLRRSRLVTLTGAGGCGKTRLALHGAAEMAADFDGGVWLVELGPLADASLVPGAIAGVLHLREDARRPPIEAAADYLQDKEALVVLDNCEHLVDAVAAAAEYLLRRCVGVRILATSREPLRIPGELVWKVPSLAMPSQMRGDVAEVLGCEAVLLFMDRARAAWPGYQVDPNSAPILLHICRALDGIPLAIELAAAKVRILSLEQIAERLSRRFALLAGGGRTALPRHRTLRATIEWSYDLLSAMERLLFHRLAVFSGGFTLEAAEFVCADAELAADMVLDLLAALVDKSMVVVDEDAAAPRYRLLETMREFALEKSAEEEGGDTLRDRHLQYYRDLAEEAMVGVLGPRQPFWLDRLEREHDNMRAAIHWCRIAPSHDEDGLRLAGALSRFWFIRGYLSEGRRHLASVLAHRATRATRGWAMAHNGAGILAYAQSDLTDAMAHYKAALDLWRLLDDASGVAGTLNNLGLALVEGGNAPEAVPMLEESLKLYDDLGDAAGSAKVLNNLGIASYRQGLLQQARNYYNRSLQIRRDMGAEGAAAECLSNLGEIAFAEGEFAQASELFHQSLAILRRMDDRRALCHVSYNCGEALFAVGDLAGAKAAYQESLQTARFLGDARCEVRALCHLGELAASSGDIAAARDAFQSGIRLCDQCGEVYSRRCRTGLAWVILQEGNAEEAAILLGSAQSSSMAQASGGPLEEALRKQALDVLGEARFDAAFAVGQSRAAAVAKRSERAAHQR
ncbi:MAG: tetratricopeptide repeat protein [Chthonomonadales bacterium]